MILDDESKSTDPGSSKQKQKVNKIIKPNTDQKLRDSSRTLSSENTSSSSSESESDDDEDKNSPISSKRGSSASTDSTSKASTPKAQIEHEAQITKKRRMDKDGTAVATATTLTVQREETGPVSTGRIKGSNANARPGRPVNERFRRVDPTKVEPIADNRYVAKV